MAHSIARRRKNCCLSREARERENARAVLERVRRGEAPRTPRDLRYIWPASIRGPHGERLAGVLQQVIYTAWQHGTLRPVTWWLQRYEVITPDRRNRAQRIVRRLPA